jgi:RsiW-degrading membrane proteinase PrsW (M82 family)
MATSSTASVARKQNQTWIWLGVVFTILGFLGHFFAARAIGGYAIAYRDHIFGFFLILVVTGGIIALLGRFFWRGRRDITILSIGVVQALVGFVIYLNRFNIP